MRHNLHVYSRRRTAATVIAMAFATISSPARAEGVALFGFNDLFLLLALAAGLITAGVLVVFYLFRFIALALREERPRDDQYSSGEPIRAGDRVTIGRSAKAPGTVVFLAGKKGEWSEGYSPAEYSSVKSGFMVKTDDGEHHLFVVANPHVRLVSRTGARPSSPP